MPYDIFISYRRETGAQYARILQLQLEKRGYRVFLDYEELTDGVFGDNIRQAIKDSPIFLMVLSARYLERCKNDGDWVREEISLAIKEKKHFIPVNPDFTFDGIPGDIPNDINEIVSIHQYSDINFGQLLDASIERMIRNRIEPLIKRRRKGKKRLYLILVLIALMMLLACATIFHINSKTAERKEKLMIETACGGRHLNWYTDITIEQLECINGIIEKMTEVCGGSFMMGAPMNEDNGYDDDVDVDLETPPFMVSVKDFYMSAYEVTQKEWGVIMGCGYDENMAEYPKTNVSYNDCVVFCEKLSNLSGLMSRLPTEKEWEYAARGGATPDGTKYAGSDNCDEVAWYSKNSGQKAQICNARNSGMYCNGAELYDMSGNVAELCSSDFKPYNSEIPTVKVGAKVVRGGDYLSPDYELTVYHRDMIAADDSAETIGFRLVLSD